MSIKLLPDIVINRLKAWEVVERPASVIKELVENSIDAQATKISIDIHDGGKSLIIIQDNGTGIDLRDSDMVLHRYATSKIETDDDLDHLWSYGFRGEALASIAEVSTLVLESITAWHQLGFRIDKNHQHTTIDHVSLPFERGTKIIIKDLFENTPVRRKFLKSSQTEYFYCYQLCLDFALVRYDIHRVISKNGKIVHDLPTTNDIQSRIGQIFKKERWSQLHTITHEHNNLIINGVISNSTLTFGSNEYCKLYVNGRPIQDRALQKAIMDGYRRQIHHGEYPLAIIAIDIASNLVDVNVHPRKIQVKFVDPGVVFTTLLNTIQDNLWENKIFQWNHTIPTHQSIPQHHAMQSPAPLFTDQPSTWDTFPKLFFTDHYEPATEQKNSNNTTYKVVWQIRDSYIIIQHEDGLRYIDQHALAERIAFEKLRKKIDSWQYESTTLLSPISIQIPAHQDSSNISEILNNLKFETTVRWDHSLIIYKVPQFLVEYHIDIEKIMRHLIDTNNQELDIQNNWINKILDSIFATRACKTSIKANHRLSLLEMQQLVNDGFEHIPWSFVCQHWRPFAIEIDKKQIDTMFDR